MTSDPTLQPVGEAPSAATTASIAKRASRRVAFEEAVLPPLVALVLAAVVGDVLILSFGQSPSAVYRLLLEGTWGNAYGFGQVLYKATTRPPYITAMRSDSASTSARSADTSSTALPCAFASRRRA